MEEAIKVEHPLSGYRVILFDADGTLRWCKAHHGPCHADAGQWEVVPGVAAVLAQYDWGGVWPGIVSNQAGIGLGHRTRDSVQRELCTLIDHLFVDADVCVTVCPHPETDLCFCRKPAPGLLYEQIQRAERHKMRQGEDVLRRTQVLVVGDSDADQGAAQRAGVDFLWANVFFGGGNG